MDYLAQLFQDPERRVQFDQDPVAFRLRNAGAQEHLWDGAAMPDALYITGKTADALAKYRELFADKRQALPTRLDAWMGLLTLAPSEALTAGDLLLREIGRLQSEEKRPLLRWMADGIWRLADRGLPGAASAPGPAWEPNPPRLTALPAWEFTVATLLGHLLDQDDLALLAPNEEGADLRLPLATTAAIALEPERAVGILRQKITYQTLDRDGKPVKTTRPQNVEAPDLLVRLLERLASSPTFRAEEALVRLSGPAADFLGDDYPRLAEVTRDVLLVLDRRAADHRTIDLRTLDPLTSALRDALSGGFARYCLPLIRDGLHPALMQTRDPKIQAAAFNLLELALKRYDVATDQAPDEAEFAAKLLESRKDPVLAEYAARLRKEFKRP